MVPVVTVDAVVGSNSTAAASTPQNTTGREAVSGVSFMWLWCRDRLTGLRITAWTDRLAQKNASFNELTLWPLVDPHCGLAYIFTACPAGFAIDGMVAPPYLSEVDHLRGEV